MMTRTGWKLVWGQDTLLKVSKPEQSRNVQLYNVFADPEEMVDMADKELEVVEDLKQIILTHLNTSCVQFSIILVVTVY